MPAIIERRELIAALAGVAAWPRSRRAQEAAMPVVGIHAVASRSSRTL